MDYLNLIDLVREQLKGVPEDHGIYHAFTVIGHAERAFDADPELTPRQKSLIRAACLLHEVDDHKFFHTQNYENARRILVSAGYPAEVIEVVIEMIDLVSCSKNRNRTVEEKWKLIPRDADRLEAIGDVGVLRCYLHTIHTSRPIYTPETVLATTDEELDRVATQERFMTYKGESVSMIDHYYDKILHIGVSSSGNRYMIEENVRRIQIMREFILCLCKQLKE